MLNKLLFIELTIQYKDKLVKEIQARMVRLKDPKPEIFRIEELVNRVKVGDIKLPKFQRLFIWNKQDILNLLDSVYKGYPIGSILLWLTNEKLASERKIGDLEINDRPEEYPINYLLDGQQRLSTLCGALYWNGKNFKSQWNICFDLENEEFFYPAKEYPEVWHFPMNKLLGTFDFINQSKRFESHPHRDKYEENSQRLLQAIKDYKIAAVTIGDMSLNEVAPIFERINSTGRSLTMVDLMRAATWRGDFDLNDAMSSIKDSLSSKNFDAVPDSEILKNIAASAEFGILKEDIDKLRNLTSDQLQNCVERCIKAYQLAVDFLTSEFPMTSNVYLPYSIQLTLLVEFFRICPAPNIHQRDNLKKWFWYVGFSSYFTSTSYTILRGALKQIRDFANGKIEKLDFSKNINYKSIFSESFSLRKASSKSFALLLAQNHPKSLLTGSSVNTDSALSVINKNEYHHIFPKNFLAKMGVSQKRINSPVNYCMLSLHDNKKISDKRPSDYFTEMKSLLKERFDEVLLSNFMNQEICEACLNNNFDKFIELRSEVLKDEIKRLIGDD